MALGQQGPPATPKQMAYLKVLLEKAGFDTYRDARRPMGLTQRQGNGKFTRQEASELIDRLVNGENVDSPRPAPTTAAERADDDKITTAQAGLLRGFRADLLADELERRGWTVTPPTDR